MFRVGRANHGPVGGSSAVAPIRGVLAFDLDGIPAGATLTGVTLQITIASIQSPAEGTLGAVELHRLTNSQAMLEGTGDSGGNFYTNDGVTSRDICPGVPWATFGGDFDPAALSAAAGGLGVTGRRERSARRPRSCRRPRRRLTAAARWS